MTRKKKTENSWSRAFTIIYGVIAWLGINTVLGTMVALLTSFYSQEPFGRVFLTAQLTTHSTCLLIEMVIYVFGNRIYNAVGSGRRDGVPLIPFVLVSLTAVAAAILGVYIGSLLHAELLGFDPFSTERFFNMIFGSLLLAIIMAAMDRWIRTINNRKLEIDNLVREARLIGLQNRMRPHFLFNTLNTIHALLRQSPERADQAIMTLAENYRFLLGPAEKSLVPFEDEWNFCLNYIELERIRFADRLDLEIDKQGDFSDIRIPPLSIQPLIENAFQHGIKNITGMGRIRIKLEREGDQVLVDIRDNGPGPRSLETIYEGTVGNIRERIQYNFKNANLEITPEPEIGTRAVLTFAAAEA